MLRRFALPALAGLVLVVPFAGAASSQEQAGPALIPEDSVQLALTRFQALQEQVGTLQQEVMNASTALQANQAEVSALVEAAVYEIDPALQGDMEVRMPAIQQEAQAAQAAANTARLQQLEQEFVALRTRAEQAEQAALEQPAIKEKLETFQEALRAEMALIDPEIDAAMDELETLADRLNATLNGG
jgi:chromosome segregation ATPase